MEYVKYVGMVLLFCSAVGVGFGSAAAVRQTAAQLQQLKLSLELMHCEIEYALTPVQKLCGILAQSCQGAVGVFYSQLAERIRQGECVKDAAQGAMQANTRLNLPDTARQSLLELFASFGSYDSQGQLKLIELAEAQLSAKLQEIEAQRVGRCRSYEILGVCTGLALVILVL